MNQGGTAKLIMKAPIRYVADLAEKHFPRAHLAAILGLGLLIRLAIVSASTTTLIQKTMPDDAFYYPSIARHMATGGSVSMDGLNQTNGFQPLSLLLISPLHMLLPTDPDLPVRLILAITAIIDVSSAIFTYKLVRVLTGTRQPACSPPPHTYSTSEQPCARRAAWKRRSTSFWLVSSCASTRSSGIGAGACGGTSYSASWVDR